MWYRPSGAPNGQRPLRDGVWSLSGRRDSIPTVGNQHPQWCSAVRLVSHHCAARPRAHWLTHETPPFLTAITTDPGVNCPGEVGPKAPNRLRGPRAISDGGDSLG